MKAITKVNKAIHLSNGFIVVLFASNGKEAQDRNADPLIPIEQNPPFCHQLDSCLHELIFLFKRFQSDSLIG